MNDETKLAAGALTLLAALTAGALVLLASAPLCVAQEIVQDRVFIRAVPPPGQSGATVAVSGTIGGAIGGTFGYISHEMSFGGATVKGVPYSAEAVTETTQTLTDGNRIHRTTSSKVYRDSEGRTRKEQSIAAIGPFVAGADAPQTIFIHDPVANVDYILQPQNHTARKMTIPELPKDIARAAPGTPAAPVTVPISKPEFQPKEEPLGTQMVEGVPAQGTRTVITIPAGQIGNDRPIQIVSERWYSPDLQVVVMSKNTDPRMGETVYRLTNISRAEPAPSLFTVPADYTLTDGPVMFQKHIVGPVTK